MNDIFYFIISYSIIFFGTFALMDFLTSGLVMKFIIVKISMGRKVLIQIHGISRRYFRIGKIEENLLNYKDGKIQKSLTPQKSDFTDFLGCKMVELDSATNGIVRADFSTVEGSDPTVFDTMLHRILTLKMMDANMIKIILILLVVVVLGLGFVGFKIISLESIISNIPKVGVV